MPNEDCVRVRESDHPRIRVTLADCHPAQAEKCAYVGIRQEPGQESPDLVKRLFGVFRTPIVEDGSSLLRKFESPSGSFAFSSTVAFSDWDQTGSARIVLKPGADLSVKQEIGFVTFRITGREGKALLAALKAEVSACEVMESNPATIVRGVQITRGWEKNEVFVVLWGL